MATTVTLSSVGTASYAVNWRGGGPTAVAVTLGSTTMTTDFIVQYTLDDLMLTSSPIWIGASSIALTAWSTAPLAPATHFTSAYSDAAIVMQFPGPIGGLRLNSTAISSSFIRMQVVTGESW